MAHHDNSDDAEARASDHDERPNDTQDLLPTKRSAWHRTQYCGSLAFNTAAFVLPALYGTLSKLWVAQIDSSMVVTTDAYTYMSTASEAVNEGLPRAAWVIIGDKASRHRTRRLQLTHTLIAFQATLGLLLSIVFLSAAFAFADSFVPAEARRASLTYVRIISFTVLSGAVEAAVASATQRHWRGSSYLPHPGFRPQSMRNFDQTPTTPPAASSSASTFLSTINQSLPQNGPSNGSS